MFYGATIIFVFYRARWGQDNLAHLKLVDLRVNKDNTYNLKYIKKFGSKADKNHKSKGTNVACNRVVPYMDIIWDNPGNFLEYFITLTPTKANMQEMEGSALFQRPKKFCKKFKQHNRKTKFLCEANMKVGV